MGVAGISVFTAVIAGTMPYLGGEKYDAILAKYKSPGFYDGSDKEKFDRKRAVELGRANRLFEDMCEKGAETEEYRNLVLYCYLLIHAIKYELDFVTAAEDLKIKEIFHKYKKVTE